jgi:threonine/homoserine/homoserine lactone efflux protein
MLESQVIYLIAGIILSIIGALPFGLVNLSVLQVAYNKGTREALKIAHGAAIVEVLYALTAIFAGSIFNEFIKQNTFVNYLSVLAIGIGGLIFLLKKKNSKAPGMNRSSGFLQGIFLNILSLQVLLYWLIAISLLSAKQLIGYDLTTILLLVAGIWSGKMTVLWIYTLLSKRIIGRSSTLSKNINRIIGVVLFLIAAIQLMKM